MTYFAQYLCSPLTNSKLLFSFFFVILAAASPSYSSASSDLYNSPIRPNIDVSGAYYGNGGNGNGFGGFEDMMTPVSAKRSRDGFDEILSDTLGSFALEAKKKRLDPSYNDGKYFLILLFLLSSLSL